MQIDRYWKLQNILILLIERTTQKNKEVEPVQLLSLKTI